MRPEFLRDHISSVSSATSAEAGADQAARDLYELLAVIMGVCESLADGLAEAPQHAELARVGRLAADRAAGLVANLKVPEPAGPPAAAEADLAAPSAAPVRKVLLVEDDPDLLMLLTAAFAREGFQTYSAKNGRIGIEMLRTLKPDLMVTDIVMPEMEGIAAILEARRSSPATKVIAISGGGHYGRSQNFLVWAHELGADEVLAKPFRMSSLITAARVVLDRRPPDPGKPVRQPAAPQTAANDETALPAEVVARR
ncbi:response regulator [Phenylobacterium sp.]|uniref:response regulator transcription factor n=1 Tax=Phenylobacterium sp. TaxID=1871053 RepID=UPI0011F86F86|nr:response regulator [Phenylobacterium sp.]THD61018.1 MAG: response regulator [Phenylobacterium sp.]